MIQQSASLLLILITMLIWGEAISQNLIDKSKIIRVLSFNIFHGATMRDDFDLDVIASVIKNAKPDVVALQEVDFKTNRAKQYDLVTELGWRTKLIPLFGKAMDFDNGAYGVGILSKYTFLSSRNVALPYISGQESRTALEILVAIAPGDTLSFISTHFDNQSEQDRIAAAKAINELFASTQHPAILAGDLNDIPGSPAISILEKTWASAYNKKDIAYTYPSYHPAKKLDYVMFYPSDKWKVIQTKVIKDTIASDHGAYLTVLEQVE